MKNFMLTYGLPLAIFMLCLLAIYFYQQSTVIAKENLIEIKGIYKSLALKTDKRYPAKFSLKNDNNIYALNRSSYKAWKKHYFLDTAKKGDELSISINKKYSKFSTNKKNNVIRIVSMVSTQNKISYLSLEDYNNHQKASYFNLYLLCTMFLIIYVVFKNIKKRSYSM